MNKYQCPCCGHKKHAHEANHLRQAVQHYLELDPGLGQFIYNGNLNYAMDSHASCTQGWACDDCLDSGKAIIGTIECQRYGLYSPHWAYYDQNKTCRTCDNTFTFSKEEQHHWYEELQFWVMSDATNCIRCRTDRRQRRQAISEAQRQLDKRLPTLDMKNSMQLEEAIKLYQITESHKQVAYLSAALNNLRSTPSKD